MSVYYYFTFEYIGIVIAVTLYWFLSIFLILSLCRFCLNSWELWKLNNIKPFFHELYYFSEHRPILQQMWLDDWNFRGIESPINLSIMLWPIYYFCRSSTIIYRVQRCVIVSFIATNIFIKRYKFANNNRKYVFKRWIIVLTNSSI